MIYTRHPKSGHKYLDNNVVPIELVAWRTFCHVFQMRTKMLMLMERRENEKALRIVIEDLFHIGLKQSVNLKSQTHFLLFSSFGIPACLPAMSVLLCRQS